MWEFSVIVNTNTYADREEYNTINKSNYTLSTENNFSTCIFVCIYNNSSSRVKRTQTRFVFKSKSFRNRHANDLKSFRFYSCSREKRKIHRKLKTS